ncbi:MAG TPA: TOMM precursor leader peptide-binding protein [Microlunatus sp.]|nr:TOMM precursor leader peptide-binding protein [Microlunatus sp.]
MQRAERGDADLPLVLAQLLDRNIHFPGHPVFVDDLVRFQMPDGLGFQFRGAESPVLVRGRWVGEVLSYLDTVLDGDHDVGAVLTGVPEAIPTSIVVRTLLILHSKGIICPVADVPAVRPQDDLTKRQLLFWGRHLHLTRSAGSGSEIQRRLAVASVIVVTSGLLGSVTIDLLSRSGFESIQVMSLIDDDAVLDMNGDGVQYLPTAGTDGLLAQLRSMAGGADLILTTTTDAPRILLEAVNDISLATGTAWFPANIDGSAIDIGPLVVPHETACFHCVTLRQQSAQAFGIENELYQLELAKYSADRTRPHLGEALWPATLAASLIVGEASRYLSGIAAPTLVDAVLRVLPVTGVMERNEVLRVARCPACFRGEISPAEEQVELDADRARNTVTR